MSYEYQNEDQDTVEYAHVHKHASGYSDVYPDRYPDQHTVEYVGEHVAEPEKPRLRLLEKAAICLVAALLVWGLSSSRQPFFQRLGHYLSVALNTDFGTDLEKWGRNILRPLKEGSLAQAAGDWGFNAGIDTNVSAEVWPNDGSVTAQPGWTDKGGTSTFAQGITIAVTAGEAVRAVAPGIVTSVQPMTQGSYQVLISHSGDWQTLYQGINVVYVQKDDAVTAAQHIGHVAQNGGLGFAVKIAQSYVDPLTVLPKRPAPVQ